MEEEEGGGQGGRQLLSAREIRTEPAIDRFPSRSLEKEKKTKEKRRRDVAAPVGPLGRRDELFVFCFFSVHCRPKRRHIGAVVFEAEFPRSAAE